MSTILNNSNLRDILMGGGSTTVPAGSYEDKFLHVIAHGLDWMAPPHQRSSYDFAQHISFEPLVRARPELYEQYVDYIAHAVMCIEGDDASLIESDVYDNDDCVTDLIVVLKKIEAAYTSQNLPFHVNPASQAAAFDALDAIKQLAENEGVEDLSGVDRLRAVLERGTIQSALGMTQPPPRTPHKI